MELLSVMEGVVALVVALVTVGLLYARVVAKIGTLERLTEQRLGFMQEQVDGIEKKYEDIAGVLIDIRLQLVSIKADVNYIKKQLEVGKGD
jgi:hypothetical protein